MIPSFFKILFFGRYIENGFCERYSQLRRFGDFVLFKECNPVNNKVLLYSIGDYIQYPEINHNGKEYKKRIYMYIYIWLNHFAVQQKSTQHCKSTIFQLKKCNPGFDSFFKKYFIYLFIFYIYFWLCWVLFSVWGLSLVAASGGHSSLSRPLLLRSTGSRRSRRAGSVVEAHGPSCSAACGISPEQGSNPCPLH